MGFNFKNLMIAGLGTVVSAFIVSHVAPKYTAYSIPAGILAAGALEHNRGVLTAGLGTALGVAALPYLAQFTSGGNSGSSGVVLQ